MNRYLALQLSALRVQTDTFGEEDGYLEGHEGGVAGGQQLHQGCSGQVDPVPAHKLQLPLNPYAHDCLQCIATPSCTHALFSHPSFAWLTDQEQLHMVSCTTSWPS